MFVMRTLTQSRFVIFHHVVKLTDNIHLHNHIIASHLIHITECLYKESEMNLNMDSFVSKLRNTVSQVAYQVNTSVNTIIPGNLIHREYETLRLRCTHGCPGFVWSVYDAVKRDSASLKASLKDAIGPNLIPSQLNSQASGQIEEGPNADRKLYSVFVFDKSQIDSLSRADREHALDFIKKGVTQLTRLRHPAILTVHHPLEESRSSLAFVTEHVYGHLESILKEQRAKRIESNTKNMNNNLVDLNQDLGPKDSDYQQDSCQLDEIQVKAGLLQVCDGLKFLHNDAKMLHRNLCLDNIFVDYNNTWKIAGFEYSCQQNLQSADDIAPKSNVNLDIVDFTPKQCSTAPKFPSLKTTQSLLPNSIVPNWSCSAPEHSNAEHVTFSSDVYSLGIISCALLGSNMDMIDLSYEYGLISDTYKRGIRLRELADRLPAKSKSIVMKYAAMNEESRPSLDDYQNLGIFNDQQVQAIRNLDSQFAWDRLRKIDFFNSLRDILPRLSHQVKVNRIAKSLFNEFVNPEMLPHVLPSILIIAKDSTPTEFKVKIFPNLKDPFRILEPKSIPLMLLDNMVVLAGRAKHCLPEFQRSAFTLIQYLLRVDRQMQEKCLMVLPEIKRYIDENSMNTIILPELNKLQKDTTVQAIRVKTLECVANLVDTMNQRTIVNHVLPILVESPAKDAEVVVAVTKVIKEVMNSPQADMTKEILAGKVLPFLIPLTVERGLDLQQFSALVTLIKSILDRVEREQREILGRKSKASSQKSGPLVLDNFKGSSHFLD